MNNIKLNSNIDETNIIHDMADIFKALSDPSRLKVLNEITNKKVCVTDIAEKLNMSQPCVSHHLRTLKQAKIITSSKEGKEVFYTLHCESIKILLENCKEHLKHN